MTLSSQQVVSLARLLQNLRADWEMPGIHSAVKTLSESELPSFTLCRQAIDRASIASNRYPTAINFTTQHAPLEQDEPACDVHGGTIRRLDGSWHCCWLENRPSHVELATQHREPPAAVIAEARRKLKAANIRPPGTSCGLNEKAGRS